MSKNKRESDFSETKVFYAKLEVKEDESNEELGIFTGHANTYKKDSVLDIIESGAFKKTIRDLGNERALFYMHGSRDLNNLLGGALSLKEDETGLFTRGELMMEFDECRKAFKAIKRGWIDRMSIGLRVIKAWYEEVKNEFIRHITELKLMEISLCPIGMAANDTALIDTWKNNEGTIQFLKDNKDDIELKNKILSFYGYEPNDLATLKPVQATLKPGTGSTHDAKKSTFYTDVWNRVNQIRR